MTDSTAAIGHNSKLSNEQQRALFFNHFPKILTAQGIVQTAQAEFKKLKKLAKADGLVLGDIDFALRLNNMDDLQIVADELDRRTAIANWMQAPVAYQPDMFVEGDRTLKQRAYEKGVLASAMGKNGNPELDYIAPGSEEWEAWLEGHADDRKQRMTALAEAMQARKVDEPAAPEPKKVSKRARKKKPKLEIVSDNQDVEAAPEPASEPGPGDVDPNDPGPGPDTDEELAVGTKFHPN
jgi:hypothetical protein